MGRWCAAVAGLWAFGLMAPYETAAKPTTEAMTSFVAPDGIENRRKRSKIKKGKMKVGSGAVQGFCKKGDVRKAVKRKSGQLLYCYELALRTNPKLSGKVTVRWTIGPGGRVLGNTRTSGLEPVSKCVSAKIRNFLFNPPESGVCLVQWPFVFRSSR